MLVLGDVVLRRSAREVGVAGEPVELRPKEFDLLAYLMENRGAVLSRDLLLERVWGYDYAGGTRTVDVHVAQLRRKLGRPDLIRTIRGARATRPCSREPSRRREIAAGACVRAIAVAVVAAVGGHARRRRRARPPLRHATTRSARSRARPR